MFQIVNNDIICLDIPKNYILWKFEPGAICLKREKFESIFSVNILKELWKWKRETQLTLASAFFFVDHNFLAHLILTPTNFSHGVVVVSHGILLCALISITYCRDSVQLQFNIWHATTQI